MLSFGGFRWTARQPPSLRSLSLCCKTCTDWKACPSWFATQTLRETFCLSTMMTTSWKHWLQQNHCCGYCCRKKVFISFTDLLHSFILHCNVKTLALKTAVDYVIFSADSELVMFCNRRETSTFLLIYFPEWVGSHGCRVGGWFLCLPTPVMVLPQMARQMTAWNLPVC